MPLPSTASTLDTYGAEKQDYLAAAVDPDTDLPASCWNQAIADLSQVSRMIDKGEVWFDGYIQEDPAVVPVLYHNALWGSSDSVEPTIVFDAADSNSNAVYHVTLPATVTDPLGESHSLNLIGSFATNYYDTDQDSTELVLIVTAKRTGPNTFDVFVRGDDGAVTTSNTTIQIRYR